MRNNSVSQMRPLLLLVLSTPFMMWAQQATAKAGLDLTQRYLLLATSRTSTMQQELNEAAGAGYRVLGGCRTGGGELTLLLEKVAQPPDVYGYKLLATQLTSTMQKELDEVATQGFRLLPRTMMGGETEIVLVLEKAPGQSMPSHYLLLATKRTGTLQSEMKQAAEQGYQVVGVVSRKEHMVILEKPAQRSGEVPMEPPVRPKPDMPDRYLLLATERTSTMQKELDKAAKVGHRILAGSSTSETEIMMLMERAVQPPKTFEYKVLATNKGSTMQKELNEVAANGFRLRRETVTGKRGTGGGWRSIARGVNVGGMGTFGIVAAPDEIVSVVERAPDSSQRYRYLVLDTMKTSTMQQELSKAAQEGYAVAAMVGSPGKQDRAQLMGVLANLTVILEKEFRQ